MKILLIALSALVLTGCMTKSAVIQRPLDATQFVGKNAPIVGLAPTKDSRHEEKVGRVGLLNYAVGGSMLPYTDGILKQRLSQAGFNVVTAPSPEDNTNITGMFNGKVLAANIYSLSFNSMDALMQPVEINVTINATVYSKDGKQVYKSLYDGGNSEIMGITGPSGETEGKMISVVIDNAINKLAGDQKLKDALSSPVENKEEANSAILIESKVIAPLKVENTGDIKAKLKDNGLLTNKEYEQKRKALVEKL